MHFPKPLRAVLSTPGTSVGLSIAADGVTGIALAWSKATPRLLSQVFEPLPKGAVVPAATATNISDTDAVTRAVRTVLDQLPRRPTRIGLVVPDTVAKVSFVEFEKVPRRVADLEELIRWQIQKAVPFRTEDAQLAWTAGVTRPDGRRQFIVTVSRRDIIQEYEQVCVDAGTHAGLIDLASFTLVDAALAMSPPSVADWLLVHTTNGSSTLAVVRGNDPIFFWNRPTVTDKDLADLVHQTAMYYEDRLDGKGLSRTVLVAASPPVAAPCIGDSTAGRTRDDVMRILVDRLDTPVESLATERVTASVGVSAAALDLIAAPIGLLMRNQLTPS